MAYLCPSDVTQLTLDGAHSAELETLSFLQKRLPNDYLVLHGVHWSNASKHRTAFGEIDFVIVNRSGAILVIEQKNGWLQEDDTGLVKRYRDNTKRVTSQIQRSIAAVRDKFKLQNGRTPGLEIDYLIYCPDHRVVKVNAAGIDMARTVDAASKSSLAERIEQLLGPGVDDKTRRETVEEFFRGAFGIAPDVSTFVTSQERVYTRMVEGLCDVIEKLEAAPFRVRVSGSAGAGKTQLTLRFVGRALARGMKPLLLCFNRPLKDRLAALAPRGITVNTYYGFCADVARDAGVDVNFARDGSGPEVWKRLQEHLVAAQIREDAKFDCLVIDEGQDFEPEWFEILELFLTDAATILWLEDPMQNLRDTVPVPLPGFVTYRETANFRNPQSIGRFVHKALGIDGELRNPLPGLGVQVHAYDDGAAQAKIVAHRIQELVKLGFGHEDVAIVSCRGLEQSLFARCDRLGPLPVRRFTGGYDTAGRQIYTDGRIFCDSIYRFKGQQAPAVILVDVDTTLGDDARSKAILYCGMTRATVRLEIAVHSENRWLARLRECA